MNRVLNNLYIGNFESALLDYVRAMKITHIVDLSALPLPQHDSVCYLTIAVPDSAYTDIGCYFGRTNGFIDNAISNGGNVLVHCYAGISRSATIVIAYLMFKEGKGVAEACAFLKDKRDVIKPNIGFLNQLIDYEQLLERKKPKAVGTWDIVL